MDVLVVGGGGREHALVWSLANSKSVDNIYCTPGNAGIGLQAQCWNIPADNVDMLVATAVDRDVDLVVVGPEVPLTAGLADRLRADGVACFGPSKNAAILEGSKAFAKEFMGRHGIPTSAFKIFDELNPALNFVADSPWGYPLVVKADGLAAGKGVVICNDPDEAGAAVRAAMLEQVFGNAGKRLVVEAFIRGVEATCMAICDGEKAVPLVVSQDHKAVYDGDKGPNTGGMGAYAPATHVLDETGTEWILKEVLQPTVDGMAAEGRAFQGVLYAGLMLTDQGTQVLEFNCRFGDPETQVVIPLLNEDLAVRLNGIANGDGGGGPIQWSGRHAACVVLAAPGYPGKSPLRLPIHGLEETMDDVLVFHAATAREGDQLVTNGGRVLSITGLGDSLDTALSNAYGAIEKISFEGMHYRSDIGRRGENKQ
ncbi:MAG TPA: phosphoribosylamine--glycine ligase [Acidobacteriota bacterium]|jgi:phosphoribosylamine--glycine ligase|nr:phosphoribosylamine--glycine ligase [Acidobacteriota bacterium]|tara:strand:- start:1510 stop:2787 length:1278 start_codon:yes stop_codon:yes gene_type:complete